MARVMRRRRTPPGTKAFRRLTRLARPLEQTYHWRRVTSWLRRDDDLVRLAQFLDRRLRSRPTPEAVAELDALLVRVRSRYLCFVLLESLQARGVEVARWLTPRRAEEYDAWLDAARIDREATSIAREWSAGCQARIRESIDVTVGADYFLVRALLEDYYGRFQKAD